MIWNLFRKHFSFIWVQLLQKIRSFHFRSTVSQVFALKKKKQKPHDYVAGKKILAGFILLSDCSEVCPCLSGSWFQSLKPKQMTGPLLCFLSSFLSVCNSTSECLYAQSTSSITNRRGRGRGRAETFIPGNFMCSNFYGEP